MAENNDIVTNQNIATVQQQPIISEENSKRITALRFFFMFLVVITHNNETLITYMDLIHTLPPEKSFILILQKAPLLFLSTGISCGVIQIFFTVTSYFQNVKDYSYKVILKKKFTSLAVPYFAWLLIMMLIHILPKLTMNIIMPSRVSDPSYIPIISTWTLSDWIIGFFGYSIDPSKGPFLFVPYIMSFWFIRDLLILTLISPFLKFLVRKSPFFVFCVISVNYFFTNWNYGIIFNTSLYYYMIGIYLAQYRNINVFAIADRIKWYEVLPAFMVVWYFEMTNSTNAIHVLTTLTSIVIFLKFSKHLIVNEKFYSFLAWISRYLFFVYALHDPFLIKHLSKVYHVIVRYDCLATQYLQYFSVSTATFTIAILIAVLIRKINLKAFEILNGGR